MASPPKKPGLDAAKAIAEIKRILGVVTSVTPPMLLATASLTTGKLYELYAIAKLLEQLGRRSWSARFVGTSIVLKGSPGFIKASDDHFELTHHRHRKLVEVHSDIQVATLGSTVARVSDLSEYHEIDIVVVEKGVTGMPRPNDLLLGIECKAVANFSKSFVREVLGRRRELSMFRGHPQPCVLDGSVMVEAQPASEYWLVFIDGAGLSYKESPAVFGVSLEHWQP